MCHKIKINEGMMKFNLVAFLFTIALVFNSCYKDDINFVPDEPNMEVASGNIEDFFSQIPNYFDSTSFNASEDVLIITENETIFEIYGGSFVYETGELVEGDVNFKYIEILNPAEYAFYGLPTISDEKRLRSEGVFRFEARQGEEVLKFKEGKAITVRLPAEITEPEMQLFEGQGTGEDFNWVTAVDLTGTDNNFFISDWVYTPDDISQGPVESSGYQFTCNLFKWINVDIFADVPESETTSVCVELEDKYTSENTTIFMLFNESKSILTLYSDTDKMKWCEPYAATPKDSKVTFIVISSQGNDVFHFALREAEIKEEHVEFISLEETSYDDIIEAIKKL